MLSAWDFADNFASGVPLASAQIKERLLLHPGGERAAMLSEPAQTSRACLCRLTRLDPFVLLNLLGGFPGVLEIQRLSPGIQQQFQSEAGLAARTQHVSPEKNITLACAVRFACAGPSRDGTLAGTFVRPK